MDKELYKNYIEILKEELVVAMGCTEPISIAFAAAKAKEILGTFPEKVLVKCSSNIIKNARCVVVPNTGGLTGIDTSALVGLLAGNSEKGLEVISEVDENSIKKVQELLNKNICEVEILDSEINLHVIVECIAKKDACSIEIKDTHTNITNITKNGETLFKQEEDNDKYLGVFTDRSILSIKDIYEFADTFDFNEIKSILDSQIEYNIAIANEGLKGEYGLGIGKIILNSSSNDLISKIKALTAAASEARMSGSAMAVVTNSGSGNQGMTVSIPLIVYAEENNIPKDKLYRGLALSNLLAIHQKTLIGRLSSFCGAVSSACASGAGITYLAGGNLEQVENTISNTLANVSGILCDGAKPSCASKIATSLDGAMMGHNLAIANKVYQPNTGILKDNAEDTIKAVGKFAKYGLFEANKKVLNIMLEK